MATKENGVHKDTVENGSVSENETAHPVIDIEKLKAQGFTLLELLKERPEEEKLWKKLMIEPYGLSSYAEDSVKALNIKLVRDVKDIEDDESTFHPEMTYQIFGEREKVIGYKGLEMQLYYAAGNLSTYFSFKYDEKVNLAPPLDLQPYDVMKMIGEKLQPGFHTNLDSFIKDLETDDQFRPAGTLINKFTIQSDEDNTEQTYEIYSADVVSSPEFQSYHERLQTFLLWYIEAASFIDIDDDKWKFFQMFERYEQDGKVRYASVGYLTVYEFFCYPNNLRPRVSQMLILPPFQSCGLGAQLLETVFSHYRNNTQVTDISVESPSEDFQRLRDYVDCKVCVNLPSFSAKKLKKGFNKEMEQEAKERLKMNKKQAQRVCNILSLGQVDENNPREFDKYIRYLKSQVDKPHQVMLARAKRKRLFDRVAMERMLEAMPSLNAIYREGLLHQATEVMLEQYRKVLERLERD